NTIVQHLKDELPLPAKRIIWKDLRSKRPYTDPRFRKTCNDALQLVESFLSSEAYFGDVLLEASTRLKALSDKSLQPLYKTNFVRVKTLMERFPERGPEYYFYQYQIEKNDYEVRQSNLQRFKISNIDAILENLDHFYVIEKLRYFCEVLSRRTFLKHQYNNILIEEIISLIEAGGFSGVPLVQIYYQIILSHLHPDNEEHYFALKGLLQKHSPLLPATEMKEMYTSALNYCNRRINQGQGKFIREAFEMYKESLVKELLFDKKKLSQWTFKNVVVLALRLGEFEWAEHFIKEYRWYIPEKYRDNAVTYNLAQLHFYQGDYNRVLNLLQAIDYQDVTYNIGAKTMLFATYYELKEWDALYALAESFKVFIHRRKNTISEGRRKSYVNLIKYTIKLQKLKIHQQSEISALLDKLVDSKEEIASANWIKEKINQKLDTKANLLRAEST
ncbi:MAG: hypothetical protein HKN76_19685, partial [Saprospiraceae bacterium]|nr:hypothetical protein [Saprospiraceae bacterium]